MDHPVTGFLDAPNALLACKALTSTNTRITPRPQVVSLDPKNLACRYPATVLVTSPSETVESTAMYR